MNTLSKGIVPVMGLCIVSFLLLMLKTPFSSMLFKISMFSFAGIMFYSSVLPGRYKPAVRLRIAIRLGGIAIAIATVGVLFRLMFWQGWETNLKVGGALLIIACILLATAKKPEQASTAGDQEQPPLSFFSTFWLPVIFVALMCSFALFTPEQTLYNSFTTLSKDKPYDQFKAESKVYIHGGVHDTISNRTVR